MKIETKYRINLIAWLAVALALSAMVVYYWFHSEGCNALSLFLALAFNSGFPLVGYVLVAECIKEHEEENIYKGRL